MTRREQVVALLCGLLVLLCFSPATTTPTPAQQQPQQQAHLQERVQYFLNSKWFQLSFDDAVGVGFVTTFFNALGDPSLSNKTITLLYDRFDEVNPGGTAVATNAGDTIAWQFSVGNSSSAANPVIPFVRAVGNCSNNATLDFLFQVFDNPENITFAGEPIYLFSGTFKYTISVFNWPFQDPANNLKLYVNGYFENIIPSLSDIIRDPITRSIIQLGIGSQYPNTPPFVVDFPQNFEADSAAAPVFIDIDPLSVQPIGVILSVELQQSAQSTVYDPSIGVLFEPTDGSSGGGDGGDGSSTLAIAIAVPVSVGVALLVVLVVLVGGVVFLIWKRKRIVRSIKTRGQGGSIIES